MPVSLDNVQKPFRKLHKSMKKLPKDPSAEEVHKLRTQVRLLEAVAAGLMLDRKNAARHLLKALKPVRKTAGDVRDMDVLEGKALTLSSKGSNAGLVRLVEHLGEMRVRGSRDLYDQVAMRRKEVRRRLKKLSRLAGNKLGKWKNGSAVGDESLGVDTVAVALKMAEELSRWPALNPENIHPFRIQAKELRYVLQLAEGPNAEFVEALGGVKDVIGDWHDWLELSKIAADVLDRHDDAVVLKGIRTIEKTKLKEALTMTNKMRKKFLSSETSPKKARNRPGLNRAVLKTAAKLGA